MDVWQSYNARKGEGGTDRYIRVAFPHATQAGCHTSLPPSLPSSLTSTLPSKFDMSGELLSTATFPLRPQLRKAEIWITMTDLRRTDCLSILQKKKFCKSSPRLIDGARVANYTSPVERGEYFWTRLLRDQLRVAKNAAAAAAVATRLHPFCNCPAPLKAAARTPCPSAKARPEPRVVEMIIPSPLARSE